jgi:arylsulfatase A-like enzyme
MVRFRHLLLLLPLLGSCSAEPLELATNGGAGDELDDALPGVRAALGDQQVASIVDEGVREDALIPYEDDRIADYRAVGGAPLSTTAAPAGAPNIVVLVADDMPRGLLGFEGNSRIHTPNLDRMRREGVYFDNFYLPIGQCAPSRSILWTALLPTRSGVETNGDLFADAGTMVLPLWLRQNGYRTGFFGKCHVGTRNPGSLDVDWHFDAIYHTEGASATNAGVEDLYNCKVHLRKNVSPPPAAGTVHLTRLLHDKAATFIEQTDARPFFAWIAHRVPHQSSLVGSSFNAPWASLRPPGEPRYRADQMPDAMDATKGGDLLVDKPPQQRAFGARYFHRKVAQRVGIREYHRRAHEQLDYLDRQIGRLLERLERADKLNNTLIVFISDNGVFYGERGMEGKGPFNYDELTRVPLVFWWPGRLPAGVTRKALIQSTDLPATLANVAGLPRMPDTNGSSFWDVATGEAADTHRPAVFFQYHSQKNIETRIRGVLKGGYKFSHYLSSRSFTEVDSETDPFRVPLVTYSPLTFELYDLNRDPHELSNLLPYRDLQSSALRQAQVADTRRPRLNDLLRTLAEFQTVARDPVGLELTDLAVRRTSATTARIDWQSLKRSNSNAVRASSEIVYRRKDCARCTVFEIDDKRWRSTHSLTLDGLQPSVAYEALVLSITATANGGFVRVVVPPKVGAGGPGQGSPRLSHIWQHFTTQVRRYNPPPAPETGECLITGANAGVIVGRQSDLHRCIDECRIRQEPNPNRTCRWEGDIFHLAPSSRCSIQSRSGETLYQQYTSRSACAEQCRARGTSAARCTWGALSI